jgi:hypothetical protein
MLRGTTSRDLQETAEKAFHSDSPQAVQRVLANLLRQSDSTNVQRA